MASLVAFWSMQGMLLVHHRRLTLFPVTAPDGGLVVGARVFALCGPTAVKALAVVSHIAGAYPPAQQQWQTYSANVSRSICSIIFLFVQ
jgi:hypothetical protein